MTHKLSYNVNEAAKAVGVPVETLRAAISAGLVAHFKIGAGTFLRPEDVERLIRKGLPPIPSLERADNTPASGVYILFKGEAVVYVGRSISLRGRLSSHKRTGRDYDRAEIIACDPKAADWLEAELIRTLNPDQNVIRYARRAANAKGVLQRMGVSA